MPGIIWGKIMLNLSHYSVLHFISWNFYPEHYCPDFTFRRDKLKNSFTFKLHIKSAIFLPNINMNISELKMSWFPGIWRSACKLETGPNSVNIFRLEIFKYKNIHMFKYSSIQIIKYLANSRLGVQTASIYSALSPLAATSGNPNTVVHKPPTTIYLSANFLIYFCIISNWSLMGDGPTPFNIFSIVTPGNPTLWCTSLLQ